MFVLNTDTINEINNFSVWIDICNTSGSAILINKSANWTSFDVVAKMRNITKIRKIGHCGTLDPFATGLLILCLGKGTKQISTFQNLPKQYNATIKIGATTKSSDIEQPEENICDISHIKNNDIEDVINSFNGIIMQVPPMFSAKKIKGRKLYELARKNIEIELPAVEVNIHSIEISKIDLPSINVIIDCSKGTYIRALARDIGIKLGVGGYLTQLKRTKIGEHNTTNAFTIDELQSII
ncbi:MAG: tRNA pseudouridine(55) synthase TruB [Bacteroidetes bacterium]|nr:tRNA pseudouridine(55) synthase TruB [Bacteroidota bacterium]